MCDSVVIDPTVDLDSSQHYYVTIASDAVSDLAGNAFAGISDTTAWSFETPKRLEVTPSFCINELDADTDGTDMMEFVELYDGGVGNSSLDGLVLVFFNGSGNTSYNAFDLDGFTTNSGGFFVVGNTGVPNVSIVFGSNGLQNGADAVGLYTGDASDFPNGTAATTTNLVDALVYDTNDGDDDLLNALGETVQYNEDENGDKDAHSLSRVGDCSETIVAQAPTPGASNAPDTDAPTVVALSPIDDAVDIPVGTNLVVQFSEAVMAGGCVADCFVLFDTTGAQIESFGTGDVVFTGDSVVIDPTVDLDSSQHYYVTIAADAVTDAIGNAFTGISDTTAWSFSTPIKEGPFTFVALINEFQPNPSGSEASTDSFEVELIGTPGAMFSGFLLGIESDATSSRGRIDRESEVMGTFDANGLLTVKIIDLENPSFTFVLSENSPGIGTILDSDDNNMIDDPSVLGIVYDAIGVPDAVGDESIIYADQLGGTNFMFTGDEPQLIFRDGRDPSKLYAINDPAGINAIQPDGTLVPFADFDKNPEETTFMEVNPIAPLPTDILPPRPIAIFPDTTVPKLQFPYPDSVCVALSEAVALGTTNPVVTVSFFENGSILGVPTALLESNTALNLELDSIIKIDFSDAGLATDYAIADSIVLVYSSTEITDLDGGDDPLDANGDGVGGDNLTLTYVKALDTVFVSPYMQMFDDCEAAVCEGWQAISLDADNLNTWECGDGYFEANAFGNNAAADDWLIS
ncbi:MAG: Ig-like domain-containing protein, partial [Bacteroidota bacterium]